MTTTEHAGAVWPSESVTGFNPVRRVKMSDASISNLQLRTKGLGNNRMAANFGWKNRSLGFDRWIPLICIRSMHITRRSTGNNMGKFVAW